jgi:subtilisin family serine protease
MRTLTSEQRGSIVKVKFLARLCLVVVLMVSFGAQAEAQQRLVVRDKLGLNNLLGVCRLLHCSVLHGVGDPSGELFVVTGPTVSLLSALNLQKLLQLQLGVLSVEIDQVVRTQGATASSAPSYLTDKVPTYYYGSTVWRGYLNQPANRLIQTAPTQSRFTVSGSGVTVAVIDTGVDPNHPVLKNSLVWGYDFTRNRTGGSEIADVSQSTVAVLDTNNVAKLNQSTVAVLDQSTVAVLDGSKYAAFGHGTMVAGLVHLVAPTAKIMPLKSFHSDGSAYSSDVLRAIYYAVDHHADVINMSWNFTAPSKELGVAIDYATGKGVVCVAAAGNSGQKAIVYPAAYKNVIDVGSTTNQDKPSTFSNYGAPPLLLAAPGEAVVTTYPFNTYAAGWGTSFSAPLVAGGTALMLSATPARSSLLGNVMNLVPGSAITTVQASGALSHAEWISAPQLGKGRLDVYQAVRAWRQNLGLE